MSDAPRFTAEDKFNCALREWKMRHRVYPRRVHRGDMTIAEAEHEILVMAAIASDYRALIEKEVI